MRVSISCSQGLESKRDPAGAARYAWPIFHSTENCKLACISHILVDNTAQRLAHSSAFPGRRLFHRSQNVSGAR